jgi:hypothetical protein
MVGVRVGFAEVELRDHVQQAGGKWIVAARGRNCGTIT